MSGITVRPATVDDAEAIATVHVASWRATYRGMVPDAVLDDLSVPHRTEQWHGRLAESETTVAVRDGTIVGFCELLRTDPPYIRALYLDPDVLRGGIGTALMDGAVGRLRDGGEREVTLGVLADNVPARAFYARHGFQEAGDDEPWHGARQLLMRLPLTSS